MANITPTVLLLDLPERALAGVDLLSFTTTPRFQGIRDLPPGWHFVFTSTNSALSIRHGVWLYVDASARDPQIFVKKWDPSREQLVDEADAGEVLRWKANLGQIWRDRLTPYRQHVPNDVETARGADGQLTAPEEHLLESESGAWQGLTSAISPALLSRILGEGRPAGWALTTASSATRDLDDIPGLGSGGSSSGSNSNAHGGPGDGGPEHAEKELGFLPVDLKRTWRPDATGRERTDAARDRSWALADLVDKHCGGAVDELLGELQFCFLMTLTLNNYSCLEQWRRLLQLVLTCTQAVARRPGFFAAFVAALALQLRHCQDAEGGLVDLGGEGATLLKSLLRHFKRGLDDVSGPGKLQVVDRLDELEDFLRDQYGWAPAGGAFVKHGVLELEDGERVDMDYGEDDEDEETGEYAPVIVDVPQHRSERVSSPVQDPSDGHRVDTDSEDGDLDDMDARY